MRTLKTIPTAYLTVVCVLAGASAPADIDQVKSFGTMGKERRLLPTGTETELFRYAGHGALTHMWFGGAFKDYGLTRIRVYVDDERQASIDRS